MSTILFDQQPETAARPKVQNRRLLIWWGAGILAVAMASLVAWRITHALTAKPEVISAIPTVSVTEVGVSAVPLTISIIGTIAARYDMPIGVEGDGGRVTAVYVEAGDHVKQGQVLAHLNNAVLEPNWPKRSISVPRRSVHPVRCRPKRLNAASRAP
jgi:HlyD family secretion protein